MSKTVLFCAALVLLLGAGCTKESLSENLSTLPGAPAASGFVKYVIPKGGHFATANSYREVTCAEMKFTVRFDSSAIYQTTLPENQWDINKLYGFADNSARHQQFSARFGWRWSEGALRLFAYVYNNGGRTSKELAVVPIGKEVQCAIKVDGPAYIFSVDEKTATLPRQSKTVVAKGYQLYPYFGGDEAAPHEVRIWIKEEK
jgi:hypothetical protein